VRRDREGDKADACGGHGAVIRYRRLWRWTETHSNMVERVSLNDLTSVQIFERAAEFAAKARATETDAWCRAAYHRLALRYAWMAAEREIEEGQTIRH
jgi:hypothetical protein